MKKILISLVAALILLTSCSTSKKLISSVKQEVKNSEVKTVDSSVSKTVDSSAYKQDSSVTVSKSDSNYERETVTEEETTVVKSYESKRDSIVTVKKKTTVKEKGQKRSEFIDQKNILEGGDIKKSEQYEKKEVIKKDSTGITVIHTKDVKKTSQGLGFIGIAVVFAISITIRWVIPSSWWVWLLAFIKKLFNRKS